WNMYRFFSYQSLSMVDKSLSTIYPYLLICEGNEIKNIFQLKIDLGDQRRDFIIIVKRENNGFQIS
ncbi:hypothetical protein BUZ46_04195, partial [Staphylococcus hominis]